MKRFLLLLPTLALTACAGDRPASSPTTALLPEESPSGSSELREPGRVHSYLINDYIDPNNPRILHQGHVVDVEEQDERWKLGTSGEDNVPHSGPVTQADQANAAPNPYTAEFESELAQQREQYKALTSLGAEMTAEMGRLETLAQKEADDVSGNAAIRTRLEDMQREIDELKPVPNAPVSPNAPKKPSWLDSIFDLFKQVPDGTPVNEAKFDLRTNEVLQPIPPSMAPEPVPPPSTSPTNAPDEVPSPGEMAHPQDNNPTVP